MELQKRSILIRRNLFNRIGNWYFFGKSEWVTTGANNRIQEFIWVKSIAENELSTLSLKFLNVKNSSKTLPD